MVIDKYKVLLRKCNRKLKIVLITFKHLERNKILALNNCCGPVKGPKERHKLGIT